MNAAKHQLMLAWQKKQIKRAELGASLADRYESPHLADDEINLRALELLREFDGLPVPVIRQVLRQAEFWLGAVTVLDCGEATEFARAVEGLARVGAESLLLRR